MATPVIYKFRRYFVVVLVATTVMIASLVILFGGSSGEKVKRLAVNREMGSRDAVLSWRDVAHTSNTRARLNLETSTMTTPATRGHDDVIVSVTNQTSDDVSYEARVQHMREVCKAMTTTSEMTTAAPVLTGLPVEKLRKDFFVDVVHKLVYCAVQKVGSSFWKRAFRVLNAMEPPRSLFRQSGLTSHVFNKEITFENKSTQWQQNQLKSSFKFLFVRDPFARTFSAYIDKIFIPFSKAYVQIFSETASLKGTLPVQNAGNQTVCKLNIPTFAKFIHLTVSEAVSIFSWEDHFTPIHSHCDPCSVPFDIVGKMETFRQDTEYILNKVGVKLSDIADDLITFDARSDLSIMSDIITRTLLSPAWAKMRHPSCQSARHEVLQRMWTLFQVRGLLSASVSYPLMMEQSANATMPDLLLAIKNGYDASQDREHRQQQRESAMLEAFRSLPVDDLTHLQVLHHTDCALFDYDCSLDRFVQAPSDFLSNHSFFKEWQ